MHLAHIGIAVFVSASPWSRGEVERDVRMAVGDTVRSAATPSA
jgi:hypothetical protein